MPSMWMAPAAAGWGVALGGGWPWVGGGPGWGVALGGGWPWVGGGPGWGVALGGGWPWVGGGRGLGVALGGGWPWVGDGPGLDWIGQIPSTAAQPSARQACEAPPMQMDLLLQVRNAGLVQRLRGPVRSFRVCLQRLRHPVPLLQLPQCPRLPLQQLCLERQLVLLPEEGLALQQTAFLLHRRLQHLPRMRRRKGLPLLLNARWWGGRGGGTRARGVVRQPRPRGIGGSAFSSGPGHMWREGEGGLAGDVGEGGGGCGDVRLDFDSFRSPAKSLSMWNTHNWRAVQTSGGQGSFGGGGRGGLPPYPLPVLLNYWRHQRKPLMDREPRDKLGPIF